MKNRGFTLIETMIYIALFSILIGTGFVTAFQLIDSSDKLSTKTVTAEEGNFVSRKIDWVFTGLDATNPPTIGGSLPCSQTIKVYKTNFSSNPIMLQFDSATNALEIKEGLGTFSPLTSSNVKVTCLKFQTLPAIGNAPSGISATTTINSIDFTVTKYIRK